MRSIPQEEFVRWNPIRKDGTEFRMAYTKYVMTPEFRTKYFSELGVKIISEIERYGYSVDLIKEFFSQPVMNERGEIRVDPTPDVIGTTTEEAKVVLFSRNAFIRVRRSVAYYRKKSSDPQWLFSWKEKHGGFIPTTEPPYWPELLIHELSHVVVIEKKMADYVKFKEYENTYMDEFLKLNNMNIQRYFVSKMTPLTHGRDFRRVYRSLCKKYGVKSESKYAEMNLEYEIKKKEEEAK
jgi:hypothetical protein